MAPRRAGIMAFTQGRGFAIGASFGLQIRSLRCRILVCNTADTASLATCFLFGKLFRVASTSGFGEKRCRKNLSLYAAGHLSCLGLTHFANARLNRHGGGISPALSLAHAARCLMAPNPYSQSIRSSPLMASPNVFVEYSPRNGMHTDTNSSTSSKLPRLTTFNRTGSSGN